MPSAESWRRLYPFSSHEMTLDDSLAYHYVDEGAGPVLLMVHGNPTWSFYWRNLITAFRDTHRAVAPDHIGCGLSDKPVQYPYTLRRHTDNLVRLIEHLDLTDITLLCHDWGGAIGLGAALRIPRRFARFVLFNTAAFPPPFCPWRIRGCRIPLAGRFLVQGLNAFARAALWMAVEKHQRMTADVRAGLLAPYDNWNHRTALYRFVQDIPLRSDHPTWEELTRIEENLPTLANLPFQFLWGMKDWCFTPYCLDRMLKLVPNAEVHRLDDAGHYVVEDAHERIVPLIRQFLSRHRDVAVLR